MNMAVVSLAILAGLFLPFMNDRAMARIGFRHYFLLLVCAIGSVLLYGIVRDRLFGVSRWPRQLPPMVILAVSLTIGYFAVRYIRPQRRS